MQGHKLCLGGFTAPDLWKRSARQKSALPLCRRKCSCLDHCFSAIAAHFFFFLDMKHLLPSEKCPSQVHLYFCPREDISPFLTSCSCHAITRNLYIWFLQNFKTVRWTIISLLKCFAEWKDLLFWSKHLSIWYCPFSCCYDSDLYFTLLFNGTVWYCLVLLTFWRIKVQNKNTKDKTYSGQNFLILGLN